MNRWSPPSTFWNFFVRDSAADGWCAWVQTPKTFVRFHFFPRTSSLGKADGVQCYCTWRHCYCFQGVAWVPRLSVRIAPLKYANELLFALCTTFFLGCFYFLTRGWAGQLPGICWLCLPAASALCSCTVLCICPCPCPYFLVFTYFWFILIIPKCWLLVQKH
jgi:hypothetical protein